MARARVTSLVIEAIVDLVLQCSWLVAHVTTDCPFFKRVEGWVKGREGQRKLDMREYVKRAHAMHSSFLIL